MNRTLKCYNKYACREFRIKKSYENQKRFFFQARVKEETSVQERSSCPGGIISWKEGQKD